MCALDACDSTSAGVGVYKDGGECGGEGYEKCKKSTKSERAMHAKAAGERIVFLYEFFSTYSHSKLQRLKNAINLRRETCTCKRLTVYIYFYILICVCKIAKASGTTHTHTHTYPHLWGMQRQQQQQQLHRFNDFNNMKIFKWKRFYSRQITKMRSTKGK